MTFRTNMIAAVNLDGLQCRIGFIPTVLMKVETDLGNPRKHRTIFGYNDR